MLSIKIILSVNYKIFVVFIDILTAVDKRIKTINMPSLYIFNTNIDYYYLCTVILISFFYTFIVNLIMIDSFNFFF